MSKDKKLQLDKKIEIWGYRYNGIWYELHVDATGERFIFDTFAEHGEVTKELHNHFTKVVKKIE